MLKITHFDDPSLPAKKLKQLADEFEKHKTTIQRMKFANLPWANIRLTPTVLGNKKKPFKTIAVVGIGGSSLGSKTLHCALSESPHNVVFFDNADPDFIHDQLASINLQQTLFLLISKSGETTETLTLASILFAKVKSNKNFIAITDDAKSSLGKFAQKKHIPILISPEKIPGRFSVLSIVGLFGSTLRGISAQKVLRGSRCASWEEAFKLACRQYVHFLNKKNITVIFPYCERLSFFADWYIQLLAESIGKSPRIGITPVKALGVKDQHSQLQLFLDGPRDKFFIFLKPEITKHDFAIPNRKYKLSELFTSEFEGVKGAFIKRKIPFTEIAFHSITEENIGELFFFLELSTAFLASLLKVDVETQPAVELSKKITQSILKNKY